jgi:hypothetical protein
MVSSKTPADLRAVVAAGGQHFVTVGTSRDALLHPTVPIKTWIQASGWMTQGARWPAACAGDDTGRTMVLHAASEIVGRSCHVVL